MDPAFMYRKQLARGKKMNISIVMGISSHTFSFQ